MRHMAATSLKKSALYLKLEQKISSVEQLYKMLADAVGYRSFYEEGFFSSIFCFWRMFQYRPVEHHALAAYLEKVGRIYQRLRKNKLPILMLDGVSSLVRDNRQVLDDLAYMAKQLAESRSMTIVFGLLEVYGPCVLNSRGYNSNRQRLYLPYCSQREIETYINKAVSPSHPLRNEVLKVVAEENTKIYGTRQGDGE